MAAITSRNVVGALVVLVLSWRIGSFINATGELRQLHDVVAHTGRCTRMHERERGFEDIARFDGSAFISLSADHSYFAMKFGISMRDMLKEKAKKGNEPPGVHGYWDGHWRQLKLGATTPTDFNPHGLAARGRIGSSTASLLVVNHRATYDTIERFSIRDEHTLQHEQTLAHELLFNLNDCAFAETPGESDVVYCTNWRSYETGTVMDAIEMYGQMPWSYVLRCRLTDGTCDKVASGISMANGIAVRGNYVVVVSSTEPSLRVYKEAFGAFGARILELAYTIQTGAACDNLNWDGDNVLLAACHPKALTFVRHSKAPRENHAPCEVIRFENVIDQARASGGPTAYPRAAFNATTVYMDSTGRELSACSVAVRDDRGSLFIGAVHDHGLLQCK